MKKTGPKETHELRKRIEFYTRDPKQQDRLIRILNEFPDLEEIIFMKLSELNNVSPGSKNKIVSLLSSGPPKLHYEIKIGIMPQINSVVSSYKTDNIETLLSSLESIINKNKPN